MIVIDSSALIAIFLREPEKAAFERLITQDDRCVMSSVTALETAIVLRTRLGPSAVDDYWQMLEDNQIVIVPFDEVQARAAAAAFHKYGKGLGTKAQLNFGDCASYALAQTMNQPLLFKGNDFTETDIKACA